MELNTDSAEVKAFKLELGYWKERSNMFEKMYNELYLKQCKCVVEKQTGHVSLVVKNPSEATKQIALSPNDKEIIIERSNYYPRDELCDNSTVRKITINYFDDHWKSWFEKNKFDLDELRIDCDLYIPDDTYDNAKYVVENNLRAILTGMRKVKHIYFRSQAPHYDEIDPDIIVESADLSSLFFTILYRSQESLKKLRISKVVYCSQIRELYEQYKNLEELKAVVIFYSDKEVPQSKSITKLDIHVQDDLIGKSYRNEIDYTYMYSLRDNYILEKILKATPSLTNLTLYIKITKSVLTFLAGNMPKLKMLICRGGIDEGIFAFYEEMKQNERQINEDIAISVENTRTWQVEFKCEIKEVKKY